MEIEFEMLVDGQWIDVTNGGRVSLQGGDISVAIEAEERPLNAPGAYEAFSSQDWTRHNFTVRFRLNRGEWVVMQNALISMIQFNEGSPPPGINGLSFIGEMDRHFISFKTNW